ncbi:f-box domain-containing protein [Rutstroemia sp. NJR-2017a BVV2]|nr:f-box domain-containing protein [Rutstroemia sp. NJR-2017a BVV2]
MTSKSAMEESAKYEYGGQNPGIESTLNSVEAVEAPSTSKYGFTSPSTSSQSSHGIPQAVSSQTPYTPLSDADINTETWLLHLPSELINDILFRLSPYDLVRVSKTCKVLYKYARADLFWQSFVQKNVPAKRLKTPSKCASFYDLYKAHDPHWFIPKYKIWFADVFTTGRFYVAKYDHESGSITLHRMVAERPQAKFESWGEIEESIIHSFEPKVRLHSGPPALHLDIDVYSRDRSWDEGEITRRIRNEVASKRLPDQPHNNSTFTNFMLAVPSSLEADPSLWPPPKVPARQRVITPGSQERGLIVARPQQRSEISDQTFRLRTWIQMGTNNRMGQELSTLSTLDPSLYMPTEEQPYKGIFLGDYSGHGCEWLLVHQQDDPEPFDESKIVRKKDETVDEWEARKKNERVYRGSISGIKLTGDPNIPRGEISWHADDIGVKGFKRFATHKWPGARIVTSQGHIANQLFRDGMYLTTDLILTLLTLYVDKYIESELIMISHDVLAQHWIPFGHISYFKRVNIDDYI